MQDPNNAIRTPLILALFGLLLCHSPLLGAEPTLRLKLMPNLPDRLTVKSDAGLIEIYQVDFTVTGVESLTLELLSVENGQVTKFATATAGPGTKETTCKLYVAWIPSSPNRQYYKGI